MKIVTREDIRRMLLDWQTGKVSAGQVHDWAESLYTVSDVDYDDWEEDDTNSVANEIMGELDKLDMNLMIPEDVPIYLEFLQAPRGHYAQAYQKWKAALQAIEHRARARRLKDDPLYQRFCR